MNFHALLDRWGIGVGAFLTGHRYFSEGIDSQKFSSLFEEITIFLPELNNEGFYKVKVAHHGIEYEAGFRIEQWLGNEYPTVIYHHGAAEGSYDFSFNRILKKNKGQIKTNLIAIQALFCDTNKNFFKNTVYLDKYTLLFASSVLIIEELIKSLRSKGDGKIIVTGVSMGGFVTNLHFTYFSTADAYKPMLSGARMAEVFLESGYRKATSEKALQNPEKIRYALNFYDDLDKRNQDNLFPLFSEYDQIILLSTQLQDFNKQNAKILPYGHSSGALHFSKLREHILENIDDTL